ncbi:TIGR00725 family protein [Candidatus Micrarchaeota archaeon]|nr:TIGR00725 family protein [Candidatus Micrarchaeota archaeon]MBU1930805.1 TIGR00725 family protein [Candidatus Micrarchaeota archaeon]
MKLQIAVVGFAGVEEYPKGNGPSQEHLQLAYEIGKAIAKQKWILLTGGKGGIMDASSRGAQEESGITVGFLRGSKRFQANKNTAIEVVTGFEEGGSEFTLVHSADALVVIGGGAGTLQEITIAYRLGKPIIILSPIPLLKDVSFLDGRKKSALEKVNTPQEAIEKLKEIRGKRSV